ncbi:MAG TPA: hypothetical protein VM260_09830 [Pirellula sp.]|nr:hypothetical protein [Pirellula sp.]
MPDEQKRILPGTIIWAEVTDEFFQNLKSRPLVVLRDGPPGQVECVCITTEIGMVPQERMVQVPHAIVGLPKICVAHAGWIRFVDIVSIEQRMPNLLPRASFEAIIRKAKR